MGDPFESSCIYVICGPSFCWMSIVHACVACERKCMHACMYVRSSVRLFISMSAKWWCWIVFQLEDIGQWWFDSSYLICFVHSWIECLPPFCVYAYPCVSGFCQEHLLRWRNNCVIYPRSYGIRSRFPSQPKCYFWGEAPSHTTQTKKEESKANYMAHGVLFSSLHISTFELQFENKPQSIHSEFQ